MIKGIKRLPKDILKIIDISSGLAEDSGCKAYLVGGFVRDLILGVKNFDVDIVIEGNGLEFSERLASKLGARLLQHKRFGTATLTIEGKIKIDIATARREIYESPASLPKVTFDTIKEDLARRDFTINAMAMAINKSEFGKLVDFYNGKKDLENNQIKILHNKSFIDDPTRIIRAIRFQQRFNFRFEKNTRLLLEKAVKEGLLNAVQKHRIRGELILLLKEPDTVRYIVSLNRMCGLDFIYPGLRLTDLKLKLLHRIKTEIHLFEKDSFGKRNIDTWVIYLMAIIDDLSLNDTKMLCNSFAFDRGVAKRVFSYKEFSKNNTKRLFGKLKASQLYKILEPLSYEIILSVLAKYKNQNLKRNIMDFFSQLHGVKLKINGDDLKKLGIRPGPRYKRIFDKVLDAKLNNGFISKGQELKYLKEHLKKI